jgi:hypothetical protein
MAVDHHASKPRLGCNSDAGQRLHGRYGRFRYFSRISRLPGPGCRFGVQREEKCGLESVKGCVTAVLERLVLQRAGNTHILTQSFTW